MIDEDLNQNISTFQFETSVLQASNNSQKLFVVDLIIAFCRDHVLAVERSIFLVSFMQRLKLRLQ